VEGGKEKKSSPRSPTPSVQPGYPRVLLAEPALVVRSFTDTPEVCRGPLVAGADPGGRPGQRIPGTVETRLPRGWRWDFQGPVVTRVTVPGLLSRPELLGDPELEEG